MDHLPPVAQPHNPIIVPYRGGQYTGHNFTDFKLPEGLRLEELQEAEISSDVAKLAAPILQVWFFFGLLHEVLDLPIRKDDFVQTTTDNRTIVTTAKLKRYLAEWKAKNNEAKQDPTGGQLASRNARVINCLRVSYSTWVSIPRFVDIVGEEIQLSIHILASTLENAVNCVSDIDAYDLPWRQKRSTFLEQRMLRDGWCPIMIDQATSRSSVSWHYYASLCPPSITHGPEYDCVAGDFNCKLRLARTRKEDYAPKHNCELGDCGNIRASPAGLVETLIDNGDIPLLEYDDAKAELRVVKYIQGLQYTAISHVWTDGMGNADKNELPSCQLRRLQSAMSKIPWTGKCYVPIEEENDRTWRGELKEVNLTPDVEKAKLRKLLFWIDTICIPLEGHRRQLAINSMRRVYSRANRVLVFDIDLIRVRGTLQAEEVLTRISLSNWLRRFWTLQEAVLAKILWFQFGDDSYRQLSPSTLAGEQVIDSREAATAFINDLYFDNEVGWYCDDFNVAWRDHASSFTYSQRLALVWSQLQYRTSLKEADRPICIATLMDMDINAIQNIPEDVRIQKLWRFYDTVPTGVLFIVSPRYEDSPYRWAPISLARLSALPPPGMTTEAIRTDKGLKVEHYAIITTSQLKRNRYGVIAMQVGDNIYLVRQNLKQGNTSWAGIDFTKFDRLAVLISYNKVEEGSPFPSFERALGALVGIKYGEFGTTMDHGELGEVIECEYIRAVSVLLKGSYWETQGQVWQAKDEEEKLDVVPARYSPVQQKWLIT